MPGRSLAKKEAKYSLVDTIYPYLHSVEAEQWVIGSLILDNDLIRDISDLKPSDFYLTNNAHFFRLIAKMVSEKRAVDLWTIQHELKQSGEFCDLKDFLYLDEATQLVPTHNNVCHYAKIVKDYSTKRQTFKLLYDAAQKTSNGIDGAALIDLTLENLRSLKKSVQKKRDISTIQSAQDFLERSITAREPVIDTVLFVKSLAMVYGYRGRGKTFFLLYLGLMIAMAKRFLCWNVPQQRGVLFIDGEMALDDLHDRIHAIIGRDAPHNFYILASEDFYSRNQRYLNFNIPSDQEWLKGCLEEMKSTGNQVEVLIFDNISSLASSTTPNSENLNDDQLFDIFCRQLRHEGYTVILAHHAGKNQDQRGRSKREDFLDLSINLAEPSSPAIDGARFRLEFSKVRGKMPKPAALECELVSDEFGRLSFTFGDAVAELDALSACLCYIAQHKPQMQMDIVEGLKFSKYKVSRAIKKANDRKLLEGLDLTPKGIEFVEKLNAFRGCNNE